MPNSLIIATWPKGKTVVSLVLPDRRPMIIMSFDCYMDLINAAMSDDETLVHLTERVSSTQNKKIAFKSVVYGITSVLKPNEWYYSSPVDAHFVGTPEKYHMIVHKETKIINYEITMKKPSINRKKKSEFTNVVWLSKWQSSLTVVTESRKNYTLQELQPADDYSLKSESSMKILINDSACLPWELSMIPNGTEQHPIFRSSNYRLFVHQFQNKTCVIQQLFNGTGTNLSFEVATYPKLFRRIVNVPNTPADLPICFAQFGSIILVFVPNGFVSIIDVFGNSPMITTMNRNFAFTCCGMCAEILPNRNCIVDIDSGDIYNVGISFMYPQLYHAYMDRNIISTFAVVSQKMNNHDEIANCFNILATYHSHIEAEHFIREFFNTVSTNTFRSGAFPARSKSMVVRRTQTERIVSKRAIPEKFRSILSEMEFEFPSASTRSRSSVFEELLGNRKINDESCEDVLKTLKTQNELTTTLGKSIDHWIQTRHPSDFWQFIVSFVVANESIDNDCPVIPTVFETVETVVKTMPDTIRCSCMNGHVVTEPPGTSDDVDFWRGRLGLENIDLANLPDEHKDFGDFMPRVRSFRSAAATESDGGLSSDVEDVVFPSSLIPQ